MNTKSDLESSVALVSAAGNDYLKFFVTNGGSTKDVPRFTASLVNQLSSNLRRIQSLGINKIAIGLLEPIGCLPMVTETETPSYEKCNDNFNLFAMNHNYLLLQAVEELNKEMGKSVFVTLDLYTSFLSIIALMQKNPNGMFCGSVVCDKPELSFFWENGWFAVYQMVQSNLKRKFVDP
ncbi:GDSL-like lipase/acylhydrolase [Medicago truncatula]|uniref:GDSL-like lipase/acylhydrolase n=1 Tax=Medicago truncatula TaxID=3880 RepID=G7I353_MEDTR|nr:GDSL-like lipase/acylhydrolase [Medicago truncatula]